MLAQSDVRNAAEKVSGATRRATGALVLAHRGEEPATTNRTSAGMRAPGQESETLAASEFGSVSV